MKMYKCGDCNSVFDDPIMVAEEYECYGRPSYDIIASCPHCYGWAIESFDPDAYEDEEEI